MKRYNNLSIYRVIGASLILVFHIYFCYSEVIPGYVVLFSKFVQGFTALSGFLYASKAITNVKAFYKKNILKLMYPVLIALAYTSVMILFIYLRNPSVGYISYWFSKSASGGLLFLYGNLWYIPLIIICYLLTPLINKALREKAKPLYFLLALGVALELYLSYINKTYPISYTCYLIGYLIGYNKSLYKIVVDDRLRLLPLIIASLTTILTIILFYFYDYGTSVIANLMASLFGTSAFFTTSLLLKPLNKLKGGIIDLASELTYPFFLVNQLFLSGGLRILPNASLFISGSVVFIATLLMAILIELSYRGLKYKLHIL